MSELHPSLEERLAQIAEEVQSLRSTVEDLVRRVGAPRDAVPQNDVRPAWQHSHDSEVRLQRATGDVLSGAAAVCFVLVIALLLRTIADNGIVNRTAGVAMGMAYAGVLLLISERRYARAQRLSHVFSVCGTLLLLSIVYESRTRFDAIPLPTAYAILAATVALALYQGLRRQTVTPLAVGIFGASLVGLLLDFPDPAFLWPAALMLIASVASVQASRLLSGRWVKWVSLGLVALFWCYWTIKIRAPLLRHEQPSPALALPWFFPCLAAYGAAYTAIAARPLFRKSGLHMLFESVLPLYCALGAYLIAHAVLLPWEGALVNLGRFGVLIAAAYLLQGIQFAIQGPRTLRSATAFTAGAVILWLLALPELGVTSVTVVFLWSASSLALMVLARTCHNHSIALMSGAVQSMACVTAFTGQVLPIHPPLPLNSAPAAMVLSLVSFVLYAECRRVRRGRIKFLGIRCDPSRRAAVLLLLAGLACGFVAARILLLASLASAGYESGDATLCAQSVLVNASALLVAVAGLLLGSGEILVVALLVALLGALKVFGYDLLQVHGMPLILSVLSFGLTAALGSTIWSRWQSRKTESAGDH